MTERVDPMLSMFLVTIHSPAVLSIICYRSQTCKVVLEDYICMIKVFSKRTLFIDTAANAMTASPKAMVASPLRELF